jgi:cytochrome b
MPDARYDAPTRLIHLLLALAAIAALVSGQLAGDYRDAAHRGFDIHRWIGLGAAAALALRLAWGFFGPAAGRFSTWLPITAARVALVREDLAGMARLRLPMREGHEGIAGLVQVIGLLAFAWLAASGLIMFFYLEPGTRAAGWLRAVKELHEAGQPVLLAYLVLHAGAVTAHSLAGHPVWQRIAPWRVRR